ncbi:MAG: AI-2E family transporter [Planctomycetota bacterium]|nr:AI-2E family transporter [Planctomycetota bacterium]
MATPRPQRSLLLILGMIATILLGWVLHVGADIIQPLVIALLLGSMLQPVVGWLAKRHIPPAVTVLLIVSGLFFVLLQVGLIFQSNVRAFLGEAATAEAPLEQTLEGGETAPLLEEGAAAEQAAAEQVQDGAEPEEDDSPLLEGPLTEIFDRQQEAMAESGGWAGIKAGIRGRIERAAQLPEEMRNYALKVWDEFDPSGLAEDLAVSGYGFVKSLVLVLIYMVFIFAESAIFRRKILTIAGERQTDAAEILDRIGRGIQRYLGVKTVVSFLTGSLCYLVLVALEIPYALLFGFITFALNFIPTFGSIAAGIFPTITALAVEASLLKAVAVIVTYLAVNLTLGSFIEPRILGRELNLSPLVVVISVVVWAGLWGVVGGFLAVPLTAALQIILASNDTTYPIAVMLGSGPGRRRRGDPDPPDALDAAAA